MKHSMIIFFMFITQVLNAQLNDISTPKILWIEKPTKGKIVGTTDYSNSNLVRWNKDKTTQNISIKLWSFDTETNLPNELTDKEGEIDQLFIDAVNEWYDNYEIKMEIDNTVDNGVYLGFSDQSEDFITPDGDYAMGVTRIPVFWDTYDEEFRMYELLDSSKTITEYYGLDVYFFSNNPNAPDWTVSTTPDGKDMLGTVMLHELGHVLSMGHSTGITGSPRIMDASYDSKVVVPTLTDGDKSNATFHYNNLYIAPAVEGDITFEPAPGKYIGTQTIIMTNNSTYTDTEIWFNSYLSLDLETAKLLTPDLSTSNMQYYYPNTNDNKAYAGYWTYFKAKLYNSTLGVFVGQQTEGAYFIESNPCSIPNISKKRINKKEKILTQN